MGRRLALDTLVAVAETRGEHDLPPDTDRNFVAAAAHRLNPRAPISSQLAVKAVLRALAAIQASGAAA